MNSYVFFLPPHHPCGQTTTCSKPETAHGAISMDSLIAERFGFLHVNILTWHLLCTLERICQSADFVSVSKILFPIFKVLHSILDSLAGNQALLYLEIDKFEYADEGFDGKLLEFI
jgi:hypothetical protein